MSSWLANSCESPLPAHRDCIEMYIKTHHIWTECAFNSTFQDRCSCSDQLMASIGFNYADYTHCPHVNHFSQLAFGCAHYNPPVCYLSGQEAIEVCRKARGKTFAWTCDKPELTSQECTEDSVYDGVQCSLLCTEEQRPFEPIPEH